MARRILRVSSRVLPFLIILTALTVALCVCWKDITVVKVPTVVNAKSLPIGPWP